MGCPGPTQFIMDKFQELVELRFFECFEYLYSNTTHRMLLHVSQTEFPALLSFVLRRLYANVK
jgi:hypothetical protein